jgi:hypothetical protein
MNIQPTYPSNIIDYNIFNAKNMNRNSCAPEVVVNANYPVYYNPSKQIIQNHPNTIDWYKVNIIEHFKRGEMPPWCDPKIDKNKLK